MLRHTLTLSVIAAALAALCLGASTEGRVRPSAGGPAAAVDSYWGSYRSCSDPGFDLGVTDSLANCEWWLAAMYPQGGATRYGIDAPAVWPVSQGAGVTVAVVDTGVAPHVDYGSNLLAGYNFWTRSTDTVDTSGHGTLIAGIIAAARGNGGFVGVAPQAHILPVKVMGGSDAEFADGPAVEGIRYALRRGADVLNLSWGGYDSIAGIGGALHAAAVAGRVVVVAAGNDAVDLDSARFSDTWNPDTAGYTNAITVAATDDLDHLAHYSNFGRWHVQIAAPGSGIQGDYLDNWWSGGFGTSYAAPQVAGVAALLYAAYPDATASQIVRAIVVGGRRLPQLRGKVACGCLLSAPGALAAMAAPDTTPPASFSEHGPTSTFTLKEPQAVTFRWGRSSDAELEGYRLTIDGVMRAFPPSRRVATVRLAAGAHGWSVSAYDVSGNTAQATHGPKVSSRVRVGSGQRRS